MTDRIVATYLATDPDREPETLARAIALEQTVEVIEELVPDDIRERFVGRVEDVWAVDDHRYRLNISFPPEAAAGKTGQLFHMLYGNVSFYPGVRLVDLELPEALLQTLPGPRFGPKGVRQATGVYGRALLATALKPRGSSVEHLAGIAYRFAAGGGDLLKDDQNLVHEDFEAFKLRVDACAAAVERANDETGRRCLYLPHVSGAGSDLLRQVEFVHRRGIPGVLICPFVAGIETAGRVAADYDLLYMAHPAMAGAYTEPDSQGVAPGVLLGTLLRISGADISVFPGRGGRISSPRNDCRDVVEALRRPMEPMRPTLPGPAGGKTLDMLPAMAAEYGPDCAVLIGGDLLRARDRLVEVTRECIQRLESTHETTYETPGEWRASSCELPGETVGALRGLLRHEPGFEWNDRPSERYKDTEDLPFRGVRRVELMGKNGEQMNFDLRYFELAPGGYTSLEKHLHTHVIIGARGAGELVRNGDREPLAAHDIAYIEPLAVHQLVNAGDEPFGFYCLVDRDRDRPMSP